jgi:hypothetical protein
MAITLNWELLQFALVLTFFLVGLFAGWKYLVIWTLGIYFAGLASDAVGPRLERLINKLLATGVSFASVFSDPGTPAAATPTPVGACNCGTPATTGGLVAPQITIAPSDLPLWQIGFLLLIAVPIATLVARRYGSMGGVGIIGRLAGGIFGAAGGILLLAKLTDYWRLWVADHGDPLANFNLNLALPPIVVGGSSTVVNWSQLGIYALIITLALIVAYAFWRALRVIF